MFYTCNNIFNLNILLRVYNKRIDEVFSFFFYKFNISTK